MGMGGQRHASAALPLGKRPVNHCIGGWMGRSGRVRKISPHPHRDFIPGPSTFCPYFPRLENGAGTVSAVVLRTAGRSVWTGLHEITLTSVHFPRRVLADSNVRRVMPDNMQHAEDTCRPTGTCLSAESTR